MGNGIDSSLVFFSKEDAVAVSKINEITDLPKVPMILQDKSQQFKHIAFVLLVYLTLFSM